MYKKYSKNKCFLKEYLKKYFCCWTVSLTFAVQKRKKLMANHKATKKDMRQAAKRRDHNRYYGKTTRNAIRDIKAITEPGAFTDKLPSVSSMIDKLAKRGIIHKNKAANLKRKLSKKVPAAKA